MLPSMLPSAPVAAVTLLHHARLYVVASPQSPLERRVTGELCAYLEKVLKQAPRLVTDLSQAPALAPAIVLASRPLASPVPLSAPDGSPEAYAVLTTTGEGRPLILAVGNTDKGLKRAVQRLVIKSRQEQGALAIPALALAEKPWMPEREYIHVNAWVPSRGRGNPVPGNPNVDNRVDTNLFTKEQLAAYVAMYDWFGFSGVQLCETCLNYSFHQSPEVAQRWEQTYARAARENGQNVSLNVWAAEFEGWGWSDPEVVYTLAKGKDELEMKGGVRVRNSTEGDYGLQAERPALEDPQVRKAFEKAYGIYAQMAPFVDRIVTQIYDPGKLKKAEDIAQALKLLEQKFKAKNPAVKLTINGWFVPKDVLEALPRAGFKEITMTSCPSEVPEARRAEFHAWGKKEGLQLGMWSWHLADIETDGFPSMHVNPQLYRRFCQQLKDGVLKTAPLTYWSEMECYHLNNAFSMYAASQLLWNPDGDPHELLGEVSEGIFGTRNGNTVLRALELIQDCRSGPKWETYWWSAPEYKQGTLDPQEDLRRADDSIAALEGMQIDPEFVPKFPLPVPPALFVDLMLPHLRQIRALAAFRVEMNRIRESAAQGTPKDQLLERVMNAWVPIPYYNVWVGELGLPEREAQERILRCLAKDLNLDIPDAEYTRRGCDFRKFGHGWGDDVWKMFRGGNNHNVR